MGSRRHFSREFKLEAAKLVLERRQDVAIDDALAHRTGGLGHSRVDPSRSEAFQYAAWDWSLRSVGQHRGLISRL